MGFALKIQALILWAALFILMILGSSAVVAQYYQAKIGDLSYPSSVRVRDRVDIKVSVRYSLVPSVIQVRVTLSELETGKTLAVKTAEHLEGSGERPFDFAERAPEIAKIWRLRVEVQYKVSYTWTNDDEGWFRDFSIEVKGLDFNLELQGLVPSSWVLVGSTNQTVGSSGTFATTLAAGTHIVEVAGTVRVGPGTRRVFKEWKDGYPSNSRAIVLSTDTTLYVAYETQYFLSLDSDEREVRAIGSGWYKEGSTVTISLDSTEIQAKGILGVLGARRIFDRWIGDDYQTIALTASAAVMMDRPQTVRAKWRTDYGYVYVNMGISTAVVIVVVAVLLMISRRRPPPPRPIITGTSYGVPLRPVPPLLRAPPVREKKFCMHCGAEMAPAAAKCPACGREQ